MPATISRSVATVAVMCAGVFFGAEVELEDAALPIPPPVAQVQATPSGLPMPSGTGAERAAYIIAVGVAVAFVLGKWADAVIAARKKFREADAGTDHQRWVDCEDQRRRDKDAITRKDAELSNAWVIIGQKDKQIEQMGLQVEKHINIINAMTHTMGANNASLIQELAKSSPAPPGSSDSISVKIDPTSQPVAVHEVPAREVQP